MDMLQVEAQLYGDSHEREQGDERAYSLDVASHDDTRSLEHYEDEGPTSLQQAGTLGLSSGASSHASKKSGTIKKYYKKIFKASSTKALPGQDVGGSYHPPAASAPHAAAAAASPGPPGTLHSPCNSAVAGPTTSKASNISSQGEDDDDGVTSQLGRGSRMSTRNDMGRADAMSEAGGVGSSVDRSAHMGSLKNMFGGSKQKKRDRQLQMDAIRLEMEMLQERCSAAENSLGAAEHAASALRAERQQLQESGRELVAELEEAQAALAKAQADLEHMRGLNTQVKGALQGAYSDNQALTKQLKELEELCSAQQNSLEEAEERCRRLTESHDKLHHAGLQLKAQLVTATAAAAEARAAREELLGQLSAAEAAAAALQGEVDARDARMAELEKQQAESSAQMEGMLCRLRELEGEKQQLEARASLLREENVDLGAKVDQQLKRQAELEEERMLLHGQLHSSLEQQNGWAEKLAELMHNQEQSEAAAAALNADLKHSMEGSELLRLQNAELTEELVRLREQQAKKQSSSPLKWHKRGSSGGGSTDTHQQQQRSRGGSDGSSTDYKPMSSGVAVQQRAGAGVARMLSDDVTVTVAAQAAQSPEGAACAKGPLAAGRAARQGDGIGKGAAYEVPPDAYSTKNSKAQKGSGGLVGKLFGCFAPPPAVELVH